MSPATLKPLPSLFVTLRSLPQAQLPLLKAPSLKPTSQGRHQPIHIPRRQRGLAADDAVHKRYMRVPKHPRAPPCRAPLCVHGTVVAWSGVAGEDGFEERRLRCGRDALPRVQRVTRSRAINSGKRRLAINIPREYTALL